MKIPYKIIALILLAVVIITPVSAKKVSLKSGVTTGIDTTVNLTDGEMVFTDTRTGMSVSTSTKIDNDLFKPAANKVENGDLIWETDKKTKTNSESPTFKYTYDGNKLKETIILKDDVALSFPVKLSKDTKLIPWDNGQWKIVSATSGNTMDGIIAEKPFGIDAKGRRVDMQFSYDGNALSLDYNRTLRVYNPDLTKEMNKKDEHGYLIPQYDELPITYPLVIDPTWVNMGGCWTTSYGGYTVTMWNATGTATWLVPPGVTAVEYLVVAAGGGTELTGAGSPQSGGGGAGEFVTNTAFPTSGTITVVVGAGVAGGKGQNSSFSSIVANGGGLGKLTAGGTGGSGGGSTTPSGGGAAGNTPPYGFGNAGGSGYAIYSSPGNNGGGGGGAGGAGTAATNNNKGGNGGVGLHSSITGESVGYAGGGAGGSYYSTNGTAQDGGGSGGANGQANTGGGAGGCQGGGGCSAFAGGSGIVIIRYITISSTNSNFQQYAAPTWSNVGGNLFVNGTYRSELINLTFNSIGSGETVELNTSLARNYYSFVILNFTPSPDGLYLKLYDIDHNLLPGATISTAGFSPGLWELSRDPATGNIEVYNDGVYKTHVITETAPYYLQFYLANGSSQVQIDNYYTNTTHRYQTSTISTNWTVRRDYDNSANSGLYAQNTQIRSTYMYSRWSRGNSTSPGAILLKNVNTGATYESLGGGDASVFTGVVRNNLSVLTNPYSTAPDGIYEITINGGTGDDNHAYFVLSSTGTPPAAAPAPTVSSITPNTGANTGSVSITNLAGTGFLDGATVKLNRSGYSDITATGVSVLSPTQISCSIDLTARAAGDWNVVVINPDLKEGFGSGLFTITSVAAPTVSSITPSTGENTGSVSITNLSGTGFLDGATVKLTKSGESDITATSVNVASSTKITCNLPLTGKAAGYWKVNVTNVDGQTGSLSDGFYISSPAPAPTVSSITPSTGENTGSVSITNLAGTGFLAGATVKLTKSGESDITATSVNVVSSTKITCNVDLTAKATGQWNVVVTNPDLQTGTLSLGFTITSVSSPTVSDITPDNGYNTGSLSITNLAGTGFLPGATVTLTKGGQTDIVATDVNVESSTKITCTLGLTGKSIGMWNVVVRNTDTQTGVLNNGFEITELIAVGQLATNSVDVNSSEWCVIFNGSTISGVSETVWFEYGINFTSGYSMKTKNQTGEGVFTATQCGMPLMPGYGYKVRAVNNSANGTPVSFIMPYITPHPTTTYEQYVDDFIEASDEPKELIVSIWSPYTAVLGGFFFGILVAAVFFNMANKQKTVALTVILMMCLGGTIWALFSEYPEFVWLAQTLFIAGMVGMIYWTITKRWRA